MICEVFVEDAELVWVEGKVAKVNESEAEVIVNGSSDTTHRIIPLDKLFHQDISINPCGVDNLCLLNFMHEPNIMDNLRRRFSHELPYTSANEICIALNPYKKLDIYGRDSKLAYSTDCLKSLPPHIFALSRASYDSMRESGRDQSLLVSGESGAGKTESVKHLLDHIAHTAAARSGSTQRSQLFEKILRANPLLESFGNAKTSRNDNSSRFGKHVRLYFDGAAELQRSACTTYLLEKSRAVDPPKGESNFHVFHELLAAPQAVQKDLQLEGLSEADFAYTRNTSCTAEEVAAHAERFGSTSSALREVLGLDPETERSLFAILSGVLHLGQLTLQPSSSDAWCDVEQEAALEVCASLLRVEAAALRHVLTTRLVAARELIVTALSAEQALLARDALAKEVYARLFRWIVQQVNDSTRDTSSDDGNCGGDVVGGHGGAERSISLLDIFGFENFPRNAFEQLCINYCNEKLQHRFSCDVILQVQREYAQEGVRWAAVPFQDGETRGVLRLFEARAGVIDLLNEECIVPQGSDAAFLSKLKQAQRQCAVFKAPAFSVPAAFTVLHYADSVTYTADAFLEKNKDTLLPAAAALLASSANPVLSALFSPDDPPSPTTTTAAGVSLSVTVPVTASTSAPPPASARSSRKAAPATTLSKFRSQLEALLTTIGATQVRYVRCIKPNGVKSSAQFDRRLVVQQLRSGGVVEAVRVSRAAYPHKLSHGECLWRFWCWHKQAAASFTDPSAAHSACLRLLESAPFSSATAGRELAVQVGATQAYFAEGVLALLDAQKHEWVQMRVTLLQSSVRGMVQRRKYRRCLCSAVTLQSAVRRFCCVSSYRLVRHSVRVVQDWVRSCLRWKRDLCLKRAVLRAWVGHLAVLRGLRRLIVAAAARHRRHHAAAVVEEARLEKTELEEQTESVPLVPTLPPSPPHPLPPASSPVLPPPIKVAEVGTMAQVACPHCGLDPSVHVQKSQPHADRAHLSSSPRGSSTSAPQVRSSPRAVPAARSSPSPWSRAALLGLLREMGAVTRKAARREWETAWDEVLDVDTIVFAVGGAVCYVYLTHIW